MSPVRIQAYGDLMVNEIPAYVCFLVSPMCSQTYTVSAFVIRIDILRSSIILTLVHLAVD